MKHTVGLLLIFIFSASCERQSKTALQENKTTSKTNAFITDGGPSTVVRTIKQDRNGNIWMTSWEGVFRYDGNLLPILQGNPAVKYIF